MLKSNLFRNSFALFMLLSLTHCTFAPLREAKEAALASDYTYIIGPGDSINIFVWDNPDLTMSVPVRPDGKVTVPLVEDLLASGKTPFQLARDIEKKLAIYIKEPQVVVMVSGFKGIKSQQIRVIGRIGGGGSSSGSGGSVGGSSGGGLGGGSSGGLSGGGSSGGSIGRYQGKSIPYERGMTLLDVIILIGLDQYAAGNRSSIIRTENGSLKRYGVRIDDLIDEVDLSANVDMLPGDILIIPESYF